MEMQYQCMANLQPMKTYQHTGTRFNIKTFFPGKG